ncbi:hypothetical protein FGIG_10632 [Fasciola gigantica]|uniref:XRCC4 N-terminal domain-containing protein n=1 Tax=Fasciola gigantica TaxID=46835 RepID=A0A504Z4C3_FASGI|nr:hypothetical protein FGIG_10632 [Fasciola gigantica]
MGVRVGYRQVDEFLIVCLYCSPKLNIFAHKSKWWQAIVDESELNTLAGRAKLTVDQFVNKMSEALADSEGNVFAVSNEPSGSIKLTWSKEARKGIQINFGSFTLNPVDTSDSSGSKDLDQLLSSILAQWGSFQSRCRDLELDNKRLHELGSEAVEKYEKLVSDLQERESAILGTCAKLLNEKKRKISSLMISFETSGTNSARTPSEKLSPVVVAGSDQSSPPHSLLVNPSVQLDYLSEHMVDQDCDELLPKVRKTQKLSSARKPRSVDGSSNTSRASTSKQ